MRETFEGPRLHMLRYFPNPDLFPIAGQVTTLSGEPSELQKGLWAQCKLGHQGRGLGGIDASPERGENKR